MEKRGPNIYQRYVENGVRNREIIAFKPELYLLNQTNSQTVDARDLNNNPLNRVPFDSIDEMNNFVEQYKNIDGFKVFGARDPLVQFVAQNYKGKIEFDANVIVGGLVDIEVASGVVVNGVYVPGPFPEPEDAKYPISMLTIYSTKTKKFHVWALEVFQKHRLGTYTHNPGHKDIGELNVAYKGFDDEPAMLADMISFWQDQEFDFTSGWYYEEFDTPYLVNRIKNVLGAAFANRLSPWGVIKAKTIKNVAGDTQTYDIFGVACLDLLNLYKKHAGIEPPNWKIDTIGDLMGVGGKIDYEDEGDLGTLYFTNFQKSVEYNIQDVNLVKKLEAKKQLFMLTFTLAYLTKSNYRDTMATVRPWTSLMYSTLHERGMETEIKSVYQGTIDIVGGFVRTVIPGKYKWVVSFDLNSLYPHCMQQYNLGTETILAPNEVPQEVNDAIPIDITIDGLVNKEYDLSVLSKHKLSMTANRQFFENDRMSVFSEITRGIYNQRAAVKKDMKKLEQELVDLPKDDIANKQRLEHSIDTMNATQTALKLLMNGLYGATANRYFTEFFDVRVAEGITTSGQLSIKWIMRKLNEYLNNLLKTVDVDYIVAGDTDSVYLTFDGLVNRMFKGEEDKEENFERVTEFLDTVIKAKIEPYIDKCYDELAVYMGAYEQRMFMKRETIAPRAIWAAKKRYTMLAKDIEGVRYPEAIVKYTGLDAKRSNIPKTCRKWLVEAYKIALLKDQKTLQTFVLEKQKEYMGFPVEQISEVSGINGVDKYSDINGFAIKGAPKHVKAALLHNRLIKEFGLTQIRPIVSGNKILMVGLKPNTKGMEVIAYQGKLPKEFGLHVLVDHKASFKTNFTDPLENLISHIGWTAEEVASISGFFM